jgi:5-methylcytosine-specific restriction endonuclease McrA
LSRTYRKADHRWRTIAQKVYDEEELCWLCGRFVNQELPRTHPMSRSADHLIQLQHGGDEYDRSQIRLAHYGCNSTRSNRIRGLAKADCACRFGRPCGPIARGAPRGMVAVDPRTV